MQRQLNNLSANWRRMVIGLFLIFSASLGFAQIPDKFINLQILPKDLGKRELLETMKNFTSALGVRCQYCHVGEEGKPLTTFDFVSDVKETKQTARVMLRMVQAINNDYLAKVETKSANAIQVNCIICHHGENRPPRALDEVLFEIASTQGVQEATKKYNELREKYYGGYAYDFRDGVLNRLAQRLDGAGKSDDALAILKLNAQVNPSSAMAFFFMGEIYLNKGDKAAAIENYKKSLTLAPENPFAKKKLEELSKP